MFRKLIEVLKKGDLMSQAIEESYDMFEKSVSIFEMIALYFMGKPLREGFNVYKEDQELNNMERRIRKKTLEHLSINPKQDTIGALVLSTVIVHMERIGDYSKNIYELAKKDCHTKDCKYYKEGESLSLRLIQICKRAVEIYRNSKAEEAKNLISVLDGIKKECEKNIDGIMEEEDISIKNAIVYSLYFRYLKRVTAHTMDILTSIWQPFTLIDFYK